MLDTLRARSAEYIDLLAQMSITYLPKVLLALIVLAVGFRLVHWAVHGVHRTMRARNVDHSLTGFVESLTSVLLKILVLVTVANMIGIEMTSFIALIGAAGLAVGLSLQGSLSNLAGGVLALFFKPYKVGEVIEAQGHKGTVERIEMFTTIVRKEDGSLAIMPNGALNNGVIVNHSRKA